MKTMLFFGVCLLSFIAHIYEQLKSVIPPTHPHVRVVKYDHCKERAMVARVIEEMVQKGGEGVVLRNPETKYVGGFTRNMYKFRVCWG